MAFAHFVPSTCCTLTSCFHLVRVFLQNSAQGLSLFQALSYSLWCVPKAFCQTSSWHLTPLDCKSSEAKVFSLVCLFSQHLAQCLACSGYLMNVRQVIKWGFDSSLPFDDREQEGESRCKLRHFRIRRVLMPASMFAFPLLGPIIVILN